MRLRTRCCLTLLAVAGPARVAAAQDPAPRIGVDSVSAVADTSFSHGGFHRLMFGNNYRYIWTTPIRVAVLDLDAFDGGLKPTKTGGGEQTRSLRFDGASGRQWVFRMVRKDARVILPKTMQKSFLADLVNDQISHSHPGGALTVPPMADVLHVLHATPQYAVMPDSPRLGKFQKEFAGQLGLLEEFPDDGPNGTAGFAGSSKIGSSLNLLEALSKDPDDRVDARAFLTARLLDLLINDWDRHKDQWKWARYDRDDGGHIWEPIPRDRDQAYIWFDGLFPSLARLGAPKLIGFGPRYPNLNGLTLNGRELDLALLNSLERPVWDSVAQSVKARLTDAVIDSAIRSMPPEYQRLTAAKIGPSVKARRDALPAEASRFYAMLAKVVDIHATDAPEFALIERDTSGAVRVRLYDARKSAPSDVAPYFDRTFQPKETHEIRVYLHGGDDRAVVRGTSEQGITVRVIGGKGDNAVADSSHVARDRRATHLYDVGAGPKNITYGPDTLFSRRPQIVHDGDTMPPPKDFGSSMRPALRLRYVSDLGLVFGAGASTDHYGFRTWPYAYQTSVWAEHGTGPNDTRVAAAADFNREGHRLHVQVLAQASGLDVIRYYGQGNESSRVGHGEYNHVELTNYGFELPLALGHGPAVLQFGPLIQYSRTGGDPTLFTTGTRPYGSGDFGEMGARLRFTLDTRDNAGAPRRGIRASAGASAFPALWSVDDAFGEAHGEIATYVGVRAPLSPVLALRAGGKKVWGAYPYFESAFLGGFANLRGFDQQRYAGNAAAWGNAELRLRMGTLRLLVPGNFGIHGMADAGRVWAPSEHSTTWHSAFGGGFWFNFEGPVSTVSATIAKSGERTGVYVMAGFGF